MIFGYMFSVCNMMAYLTATVTGVIACVYLVKKMKREKEKTNR